MKAIRVREFGDPEVMQLEECPDLMPNTGEVVVGVKAVGVNPVETYIRSGTYAKTPSLPYTPGLDGSGIVESVGNDVSTVNPGDRVYIAGTLSGSYAEQALCGKSQVHSLPENISFAAGAALGTPYGTAYRALFQRAQALPSETVLVHGATGGVGIAALQLARAADLQVIATGGSERGRTLLTEQGAHFVLNHHEPGYLEKIPDLIGVQGVDIVVEMLANVNLARDLRILSYGGRVVVIGNRGTIEINPRDTMTRDAAILGMVMFNTPERDFVTIHTGISAGLLNGTICPVVGKEMPLSKAAEAHRSVMAPGAYGKIVLIP